MSIIKFKSKAAADIVMLKEHAETLLSIMGKTLGERGVIEPNDLPQASAQLQAAITQEKMAKAGEHMPDADDLSPDQRKERLEHVSLEQRAYPLLQMMQEAQTSGKDVHWGF